MSLQWIGTLLTWFIPLSLFAVAMMNERKARWQLARGVSLMGLVVAVFLGISLFFGWVSLDGSERWTITSPASLLILGLVSFIGFINVGYSRVYMSGNTEEEKRYLRWLLVTLGSVLTVVITNHMLVLVAAWIAISFSLHRLLVFFPNRQRAALAAHKKFIFARVAEAFLLAAILILYYQHGSWFISDIREQWLHNPALSQADKVAAFMLAAAALVKCAQLPLHGWLIQVVEAPTPVSALLHAGIINLGGYLLIIFAPLIMASDAAQWLLLIVGGITTVLAALIMMTRASVKVRLAWSTMSQMGLMLVECGLGLFELALLHLIAHSCYKAYAFLNSGSEVDSSLKRRLSLSETPSLKEWIGAALASFVLVYGFVALVGLSGPYSPWLLLGVALTLLIAERNGKQKIVSFLDMFSLAAALLFVYFIQKSGVGFILPPMEASLGWIGDLWISLLIVLFVSGYLLVRYQADSPSVIKFRRALYAGFYLDEWVTRMNLRLYPTRLPMRVQPKKLQIPKEELYQ